MAATISNKPKVQTVIKNGVIIGGVYTSGNWTNYPITAANVKK
jgi:inosine-uridine nucleoside N-ribohydrolase